MKHISRDGRMKAFRRRKGGDTNESKIQKKKNQSLAEGISPNGQGIMCVWRGVIILR